MTRRRARGLLVVVLSVAALATALTSCTSAGRPAPGSGVTAESQGSETSLPTAVTAAAIGDSIAIGNGVPAKDAWPLLVADHFGWTLSDFAETGAGFTQPGVNTHIFDDQVSAVIRVHPSIVIVGATRNDVYASTATLKKAATAALQRLRTALPRARIIGVSPLWGSDPAPAQIPAISATVRASVAAVGGSWVELGQPFQGHRDLVHPDRVHPTVEGQKLLARAIEKAIAAPSPPR